jgi:hypothetical protein
VAVVAAVALLIALVVLALPTLPCQIPGGEACAPEDEAAELVPADALAYLHANVDPDTEQYRRAREVAGELPTVSSQIVARALAQLPASTVGEIDFDEEIGPWFGGEAAVALLPTGEPPQRVALLEVADADGADEFASALGDDGGAVSERVGGFLAIGESDAVAAVADLAEGGEALAGAEGAARVLDELPDHRLAEAYLSEEGVAELIADPRGGLGSLAPFVDPASRGAAAAVAVADDGELEFAVRSDLDPERSEASPGFFDAFDPYQPQLPERLAADSLGYVGIGNPGETLRALLAQAAAQAPSIAAGFEDLLSDLERGGGLDVEGELGEAFGGEAAFALQPATVPYLEFVATEVDEDRARAALAALGAALGQPVGQEEVEGVQTTTTQVSPTVQLSFAVFEGLAAVATNPDAIGELAAGEGGLDEAAGFERATEGLPDEVSLLAYLDLGELVTLGEGLGLAEDPVYATFAGEFRKLDAFGLAVVREDEILATDARLVLAD